jgi:glycosyltransferase involved in cell wall biosynthesis
MVGEAGEPTDISQPGGLATQFTALADPALRRQFAQAARLRAEQMFSEDAVVAQYLEMYRAVAAAR